MKCKIKPTTGLIILGCLLIVIGIFGFKSIANTPDTVKSISNFLFRGVWCISLIGAGIGILFLKNWARVLTIILIVIKTVQMSAGSAKDLRTMINLSAESFVICFIVVLIVFVIIIGSWSIHYLSRPKVKKLFR